MTPNNRTQNGVLSGGVKIKVKDIREALESLF